MALNKFINHLILLNMTKTQNDFFANTQTVLDSRKDFQADVVTYPKLKNSFNLYGSHKPGIETQSFLVDWQLPKVEKRDAKKTL